jgi:hypothetical protein
MIGFDYARTFNPPSRLGTATGVVNVGGFVASLVTIEMIGLILDARTGGHNDYGIDDFKIAMSVQYLIFAIGLVAICVTAGWLGGTWPPRAWWSVRCARCSPSGGV